MRQKKILFVLWSGNLGGSEKHVLDLIRLLPREEFLPSVCFLTEALEMASILAEKKVPFFEVGMRSGMDVLRLPRLKPFLRQGNFDIIHEHGGNKLAVYAYRLYSPKSRTVFTIHNGELPSDYKKPRLFLELKKIGNFDRVLSVSERISEAWRKCSHREIRTVELGVELERFSGVKAYSADGALVSVSRLIPSKRVPLLVRLCAPWLKRTGRKLRIAGEGPDRANVEREIRNMGLESQVELFGFQPDISEFLKGSAAFVFASEFESGPLVVREAMACGLPVVSTFLPSLQGIVQNGETGFLVEETDFSQMQKRFETALDALTANALSGEKFSEASRKTAARFDEKETARHLVQIYREEVG